MRARGIIPGLGVLLCALVCVCAGAEEPALPAGLGGQSDEPELPAGIGGEPQLPAGLGGEGPAETAGEGEAAESLGELLGLSGFWEVRGGVRTRNDRFEKDDALGETRLQLDAERAIDGLRLKLTTDFLHDWTLNDHSIDLESGDGWIDLRQANAAFSPLDFMDVKVGRQILTWGTGDLVFVNDLFPKDWQSFFIGRDVEYLKAPSDAVRVSLFSEAANLEIVYTPKFDPDRYITGERISYYSDAAGGVVGRNAIVKADRPNDWIDDDEWALRLSRNVGGRELALYGYDGFWKSPGGSDPATMRATFPRLSVYGASARGQAGGGIANAEVGYYDSRDDASGGDPFVRNSQLRFLLGYERDLKQVARDFTAGVQYYLEWTQDYGAYRRTLPAGFEPVDEYRHVYTLRLTKLLMNQNLELSLFTFYCPGDQDAYLRPRVSYKINDNWSAEVGGNVFIGCDEHTFFGQFENNSNVYAGVRYGF